MKKLLFILLFVPLLSFGQSASLILRSMNGKGAGEWSGVNIDKELIRVDEKSTYHWIDENDNKDKNYETYGDYKALIFNIL